MALSYFHSVQAAGVTFSVDMLTLRGSFQPEVLDVDFVFPKKIAFLDAFCARMRAFCICNKYDYEYFESFKFLTYRDAWILKRLDGATVKFFFRFRGYDGSSATAWKIQFNPNKVFPCDGLVNLILWIKSCSGDCRISAFDAAADLSGVRRSDVFMIKDRRKYQLVLLSAEDKTEYLGCRGQNGFCKLYNKQIESDLPDPLTRFELSVVLDDGTTVCDLDLLRKAIPPIYVFDGQLSFGSAVAASDLLLVRYCLEHPDGLLSVDHRKKTKLKNLIASLSAPLDLDVMVWFQLYGFYRSLFYM